MTLYLSPIGGAGWQFFSNNGEPLVGGKLYTYSAGTTNPLTTYTSSDGNTEHTNPIILDSAGRVPSGEIWITYESYKFILKTSTDVLIATYDDIRGNGVNESIFQNFEGDGATTNFDLYFAPYSKNSLFVYINGVYQQRNTYSLSDTVLFFSEAPPKTSSIEVIYN